MYEALERGAGEIREQLQIIATLGRVGTPDAVQHLVALAEPGGTLFKRKAAAVRVAAVEALGEAATPAALDALADGRLLFGAADKAVAIKTAEGNLLDARTGAFSQVHA